MKRRAVVLLRLRAGTPPSTTAAMDLLAPLPSLPLIPRHRSFHARSHRPQLLCTRAGTSTGDRNLSGQAAAPPPPLSTRNGGRRSLAVATGEAFIGLATMLVRAGRGDKSKGPINGDADEGALMWDQRKADVEAEDRIRCRSCPGFSFSAAGLLFPYHIGVAQYLIEHGYIKESTPLAGSSAGAIIGAVIASGNTMQDTLLVTKKLAEDCRLKGTAFRLGSVLRGILNDFLPEDVHIRCSGRVRVAITQLAWRPRGLLVDQFDSKEDLINAVITSSFIPGYLAPRPATFFRNRLCIDGGLTLFMPPTSASKTVRVCAFSASRIGMKDIGISPDCNPDNRASTRQLLNWALEPADDDILDKLYELGYLDAGVWAEQNPVDVIVTKEVGDALHPK